MKLKIKTVYWIGFLLYLRVTLVIVYNLFKPLDIHILAYYLMTEFFIDMLTVFFRFSSLYENIFTFVHHFLIICVVYNEYAVIFTTSDKFSYKMALGFILAGSFDLVSYSQILFKNINITKIMYFFAIVRTIGGIIIPIYMLILGGNLFSYLASCFNILIIILIWYYRPENIFVNPYRCVLRN